jgi:hypothetical protein
MALDILAPRIAAELRSMALATEALAATLCADEEMALKCLGLLQQFDHLAQSQAELAELLLRLGTGSDGETALKAVRLACLAERLAGTG